MKEGKEEMRQSGRISGWSKDKDGSAGGKTAQRRESCVRLVILLEAQGRLDWVGDFSSVH
jgi:hypothetical protein